MALAEARERGDQREATWLWFYENHCADPRAERLHAFVSLAFHEPRVRALWLHTSHFLLTFSTGSGWPHTGDLPVVDPVGTTGQYVVRTRDRQIHPETDAAGALRLLLAALS